VGDVAARLVDSRLKSVPVMRLVEIKLELPEVAMPANVVRLLAQARRRIAALEKEAQPALAAFVPSDFELVYKALLSIQSRRLATGRRFIEWGSGLGVVTCLAEWAGFDAVGIEIEPRLVQMAETLAAKYGVASQFVCGSFVPPDAELRLERLADIAWLSNDGPDGYNELELEPDDFDVVFAYPWPGEEQVIFDLFADCAAVGALLLTYHGLDGVRLQRKVRG
jgi:predicted O-methyltransferase YrrM